MEIKKELQAIKKNKSAANRVLDELEAQREEMDKKIHLIKVVQLASLIEDLVATNKFEENDIATIKLWNTFDEDVGYKLAFEYNDKDGGYVFGFDETGHYIEPIAKMQSLLERFDGLNLEDTNDFKPNSTVIFDTVKGCEDNFLELLLSTELKKVLNYSQLENNLRSNEEVTHKKMKV